MEQNKKKRLVAEDIKFKGILNYQSLKILAWIFMAIAQLAIIFRVAQGLHPDAEATFEGWTKFAVLCSSLPFPLFLLANFSSVLTYKGSIKKLLIQYAIYTGLMFFLFIFLCSFYILRSFIVFQKLDPMAAYNELNIILNKNLSISLTLNVFIDLFMCILLYFFMSYKPKNKFFTGKKRIYFRLLAILPFIYQIVSTVIKAQIQLGNIVLPFVFFPLLTNKPFFTFIAFFFIMGFIVARERLMNRRGYTEEECQYYLESRRRSFYFSLSVCIVFALVALLDFLFTTIFIAIAEKAYSPDDAYTVVTAWGLGQTVYIATAIPFVILFDYKAKPYNKALDGSLPFIGILIVAITVIEGFFEVMIAIRG